MKGITEPALDATIIAVGGKTIVTRQTKTDYRGPLIVHGNRRSPTLTFSNEAGYGLTHLVYTRGPERHMLHAAKGFPGDLTMIIPGTVTASCQLIDCVPIVGQSYGTDARPLLTAVGSTLTMVGADEDDDCHLATLDDQLPFGDFTPGRYAWLLGDVKPTTERCPRCWGAGYEWAHAQGEHGTIGSAKHRCITCRGAQKCPPVPMRGKTGLWVPTWETA